MTRSLFRGALAVLLAGMLPAAASCNRRVFEQVQNSCDVTIGDDIEVPTEKAADILIVVDNSGSMLEEQQNLADNFLNKNRDECPLFDLKNIPAQYKNPVRDLYTGDGPLAQCGFIQLLAAFENDFRVGVITTDVGNCDNKLPDTQCGTAWGFRPQRGCLQPDSAPGGTGRKLIAASDLNDDDLSNDLLAERFAATLENTQTCGSPYERGLDAMAVFLDPAARRHPSCDGDLETFRRADASLVVIFLTDEEDCSHGLGGSFKDELADEGTTCGADDTFVVDQSPAQCYEAEETLSPIQPYVDALLAADPNAKVAVIAGGLGLPGNVEPAGCTVGTDGTPSGACEESRGLSNFQDPGQPCNPAVKNCCLADAGDRYYQFANAVGQKTTDSICNQSFRGTMLDIAAFIAAVDFVELAEPPANPDLVLVELTRVDSGEVETIRPLPPGGDCATDTGWRIENDTRVILCGEARPGPGDKISVRAKGAVESCE